jgi:DNA-binding MarR family transcriptional regulator
MTLQVYQNPVGDCHQLGGVQLPQADIAKATQPGLFDDLPESAFTVDHKILVNARPADRMLACLALPVSNAAKIVAAAIAYHGWSSWPSRETLCRLTDLKSPNVSRATKELEEAGIIARRRRYHSGGNVGIQYTFNGLALAKATVEQEHPTLQGAIINVITAESDGSAEGTPAQIQKAGRDYHIDNGAIITLIPEPEDRTGRGTLIDDHQSTSGSSDLTNDLLGDSDARAKTLPAWFQELARKVDSNILPNFRQVDEARMLAGWSEAVMRQAVQTYVQVYRGKTVNAPETLFRKLAIEAARKAPASTSGDELPKYAADQRRRRGSR